MSANHAAPPVAVSLPAPEDPAAARERRRVEAFRYSEEAQSTRVLLWRDRLQLAGLNLTASPIQTLNKVALEEGKIETEEFLEIEDREAPPTDVEAMYQRKLRVLNRQNET